MEHLQNMWQRIEVPIPDIPPSIQILRSMLSDIKLVQEASPFFHIYAFVGRTLTPWMVHVSRVWIGLSVILNLYLLSMARWEWPLLILAWVILYPYAELFRWTQLQTSERVQHYFRRVHSKDVLRTVNKQSPKWPHFYDCQHPTPPKTPDRSERTLHTLLSPQKKPLLCHAVRMMQQRLQRQSKLFSSLTFAWFINTISIVYLALEEAHASDFGLFLTIYAAVYWCVLTTLGLFMCPYSVAEFNDWIILCVRQM